ncbi:hypothetical protein KEM56_006029 [Ascosphaera pollenicola]|nr:hypothetical protein KEM56_006029 [Ascosphaera pollenicola]
MSLPVATWLPKLSRGGVIACRASPAAAVINSSLRSSSACARRSFFSISQCRPLRSSVSSGISPRQTLWARQISSSSILQREAIPEEPLPSFVQHDFQSVNASLGPDTILVDVREPTELKSTGIIPGAVNIPLKSSLDAFFLPPDEFEDRFGFEKPGFREGGEKKNVIFYCLAGIRALSAAELARQAGCQGKIGVYGGSWQDWDANKGKVEKWDN